jgi:threonine dehydratase
VQVNAPRCEVLTVEPAGFDKMRRSLAAGDRLSNPQLTGSICDALLAPAPGVHTFPVLARRGARGLAVTDDEVRAAMRFAFDHFRLVLEPGGAAALAAALQNEGGRLTGKTTVVIASGGNVDPELFKSVLG